MELKNNYKFIYEVIDSANRERTFFATKDNDVNPENDDKVAGPYKIGTYKVVYQKGNKIVGIKEYGQEPEEIIDLSQFTEEGFEPEPVTNVDVEVTASNGKEAVSPINVWEVTVKETKVTKVKEIEVKEANIYNLEVGKKYQVEAEGYYGQLIPEEITSKTKKVGVVLKAKAKTFEVTLTNEPAGLKITDGFQRPVEIKGHKCTMTIGELYTLTADGYIPRQYKAEAVVETLDCTLEKAEDPTIAFLAKLNDPTATEVELIGDVALTNKNTKVLNVYKKFEIKLNGHNITVNNTFFNVDRSAILKVSNTQEAGAITSVNPEQPFIVKVMFGTVQVTDAKLLAQNKVSLSPEGHYEVVTA